MLRAINPRLLLSGITLLAAVALTVGGTLAWFSDVETSKGNVLAAGAIDLHVDNVCYYNGNACVDTQQGSFWDGDPEKGPCACNWELTDLTTEKFYSFRDLKPGDWEEDTISLHVAHNDSWLCADVHLTSDDDNGITEPEGEDGDTTDGAGNGDLANAVNFIWWADDGDNVLESDERTLPSGPMGVLNVSQTATVALADSDQNIWGQGPFPGGDTRYIGKGFCFGDITETPVVQDGQGATGTNGPDSQRGGGFTCDGASENNVTQTDSFTADISFRAVQARNNDKFQCEVPSPTPLPS